MKLDYDNSSGADEQESTYGQFVTALLVIGGILLGLLIFGYWMWRAIVD